MRYPIAVEMGDAEHAHGVWCLICQAVFRQAIPWMRRWPTRAILLQVEGLLDDGQPFPRPSTIEQLGGKRSYRGWTWAIVDVSELGVKTAMHGR